MSEKLILVRLLSSLGIDVYCVDLLGWGYTQLDPSVLSYSARAKVEALRGLWEVVGGNGEVVVGGASLGGAAVIEYAADVLRRGDDNDYGIGGDFVRGTVLIDAQGFVDGIGPMSYLPAPIARLGIRVLKSEPLRSSANRMSYYDVESYATEDALRVGRLHTLREGWEDGMLSFMRSGGFRPREKVPTIGVPTLVLWGRQDGILDGEEYANMFVNGMPDATLRWIEECGHVPHLEQPETTARHIADFLMSEGARPSRRGGSTSSASRKRADAISPEALCARQRLRRLRQRRCERNDNNGDSVDHRRNNYYYGGGPLIMAPNHHHDGQHLTWSRVSLPPGSVVPPRRSGAASVVVKGKLYMFGALEVMPLRGADTQWQRQREGALNDGQRQQRQRHRHDVGGIDYLALAQQCVAKRRELTNSVSTDDDWLDLAESRRHAAGGGDRLIPGDNNQELSLNNVGGMTDVTALGMRIEGGVMMMEGGIVVDVTSADDDDGPRLLW
ncbi:hypothetical protein ACHAW5_010887 [Stephanodiscus triporus]|uniref:AB hydrolase-1 domain-containing protein n=1 Tax=Stephanodiscus triporus TaxID=2934178 RepID=A0ABD3PA90_9STRA